MGSFLIAVCRFVKLILGYIAKQAKAQGNQALACIASCLSCCVDCFQRFIEMLNKNAYIDIAINSNTFCTAAKASLEFMIKNAAQVGILSGACFCFVAAGVAVISTTTAY